MHAEDMKRVGRLLSQEQAAFREFFDDCFPRQWRFVLRRIDDDQKAARDIVQAALTRGVRRLKTYRGEASLFT